jgi:hypothetical protein
MFSSVFRSAFLAAPLLIVSTGAMAAPPVEVTRFHTAEAARSGTVRLVADDGLDPGSLEYRTFASAVADAMTRAGFTPVLDETATYTARIGYERHVDRPVDDRGSPVSVGVGGATGRYGGGLGVGIGINLSGKPKATIGTLLRVQMRQTDSGQALWEGRAETAARENKADAQTGVAAARLANALFKDYPGQSGATIKVK